MRVQPRWGVLPLLAAPVGTWAFGLGDIELQSALNQPFQAQISLVSPTREDIDGLTVTLATPQNFERYGLDRPGFLADFSFSIGRDATGREVIVVRSQRSVSEPFVTMLVEASWPSGRTLREYTVLLDPPILLPAAPVPVRPAEARQPEPNVPAGEIRRPAEPAPAPAQAPAPRPAPAVTPPQREPAPVSSTTPPRSSAPVSSAAPPARLGGSYGPVQRAETLWNIAERLRPSDVTMNQMMVAIYRANPQAFDNNMNLLRRGAVLRIPEVGEVRSVDASAATAEFRRQVEAWQSPGQQQARLRLVTPTDEPPAIGANAGGGAASPVDSGELTALRGQVDSLQADLAESQRLLELRDQELLALQNQLSAAREAELTDTTPAPEVQSPATDPGVDLESEQLFTDEPIVEPEPEAEVAETPVVTPPVSRVPAATTTPEPSLLTRAIDFLMTPMVLVGLGVGALLLTALLFMRRRREDVDDVTGRWEALEAEVDAEDEAFAETTRIRGQSRPADDVVVVEESRAAEDPAATLLDADDEDEFADDLLSTAAMSDEPEAADDTLSSQTVINLDQADPIAEADFHMAYGLYDQAAELVSKALEATPDSRDLKLKLLEVFFVWGNKESFLKAAQALRQEMGGQPDKDWDKVIIMGKQICPDDALFADATAAAGEVDLDLEAGGGDGPALDLAFDDQTDASVDLNFDAGEPAPMSDDLELEATGNREELEVTGNREELEATGNRELLEQAGLDIGAQTQAGLDAALFGLEKDDTASATSPDIAADLDSLAATQESPTVETPQGGDDWSGATMESPTIETSGPVSDTVEMSGMRESPTVETEPPLGDGDDTTETPTIEQTGIHTSASTELTAELDLDDLGLDVDDLEDLPSDLGDLPSSEDAASDTREQPTLGADEDDLLSATGVTQVLQGDLENMDTLNTAVLDDEEATMLAPGLGGDDTTSATSLTGTEVLEQTPALDDTQRRQSIDLDLDDLSEALEGGDTVEQPRTRSFDADVFTGATNTPVDLDIGDDAPGSDDPTSTEEVGSLDSQTMTEVGTKLDLARAYIDMGDPEGARSILQEVLDEGDSSQKQEAQTLIDVLSA